MARREFSKAVRREIVRRATREVNGKQVVVCEGCGLVEPKVWHVDHTIPDGLFLDKKRVLVAADGKVLCAGKPESCHGTKTPQDVKVIAKAVRNDDRRMRVHTGPTRKLQGPSFVKSPKAAAVAARGHKPPVTRARPLYRDVAPAKPAPRMLPAR